LSALIALNFTMSNEPSQPTKCLLCVDDDRDTRELLTILLSSSGYRVITAATVSEGLDLAKQGGFALMILDNWLGAETGIELCKTVRSFDPDTPILFYSAVAYRADADAALSAGANGYMVKPSDPNELLKNIDQLIRRLRPGASTGLIGN
jgi:DNA-binding response OmpR family regulator